MNPIGGAQGLQNRRRREASPLVGLNVAPAAATPPPTMGDCPGRLSGRDPETRRRRPAAVRMVGHRERLEHLARVGRRG